MQRKTTCALTLPITLSFTLFAACSAQPEPTSPGGEVEIVNNTTTPTPSNNAMMEPGNSNNNEPEEPLEPEEPVEPEEPIEPEEPVEPEEPIEEPPALPSAAWCDRATGGAPTSLTPSLALSDAHAKVRFFGAHNDYTRADSALTEALEDWHDFSTPPDLARYAAGLDDVCQLTATDASLGQLEVDVTEGVAFVSPGAGTLTLPDEVDAVIIDLREVSEVDGLQDALTHILEVTSSAPITLSSYSQRRHNGLIDEVFSPSQGRQNIYTMEMFATIPAPLDALGSKTYKLAVWVDDDLPPTAAAFAGSLKLQGEALLLGEDIHAAVAESSWVSIGGDQGVLFRHKNYLVGTTTRWPDVIPSNLRVWQREQAIAAIDELTPFRPILLPPATRPAVEAFDPVMFTQDNSVSAGSIRASLITAHGAADLFFAYFDEVGRGIDDGLEELLADIDLERASTRAHQHQLLARLMHHVHDGHAWVQDRSPDQTSNNYGARILPIRFEHVARQPHVEWSDAPDVNIGDKLVKIDGVDIADIYEARRAYASAATPENELYQLSYDLLPRYDNVDMEFETPDGTRRTVTVAPVTFTQELADKLYGARSSRQAGWLTDLGYPDVYYINLDAGVISADSQLFALFPTLANARHVVLDMRGYPGVWSSLYQLAGIIVGSSYGAPMFGTPTHTGPNHFEQLEAQGTYPGPGPGASFTGNAALLVGPRTQSAAENFSMGLVTEQAVTVVGRQSSGSNGNITGLLLPGRFAVTFTGLDVRYSDGQAFHARGIQPTVRSERSAQDLIDGVDRELLDAAQLLTSSD